MSKPGDACPFLFALKRRTLWAEDALQALQDALASAYPGGLPGESRRRAVYGLRSAHGRLLAGFEALQERFCGWAAAEEARREGLLAREGS